MYTPDGDLWLKREEVEDIARAFNISVVPIVMTGTIREAIDFVKSRPYSTIGTARMEGVVGRPLVDVYTRRHERVIVKIKVRDFA